MKKNLHSLFAVVFLAMTIGIAQAQQPYNLTPIYSTDLFGGSSNYPGTALGSNNGPGIMGASVVQYTDANTIPIIDGSYAFQMKYTSSTLITAVESSLQLSVADVNETEDHSSNANFNASVRANRFSQLGNTDFNDPTGTQAYVQYTNVGVYNGQWVDVRYSIISMPAYFSYISFYNDLSYTNSSFGIIVGTKNSASGTTNGIKLRFTYYIHGTSTPISIKGMHTWTRTNGRRLMTLQYGTSDNSGFNFDHVYTNKASKILYCGPVNASGTSTSEGYTSLTGITGARPTAPLPTGTTYNFYSADFMQTDNDYVTMSVTYPLTSAYDYQVTRLADNSYSPTFRILYGELAIVKIATPAPENSGYEWNDENNPTLQFSVYQSFGRQSQISYLPKALSLTTKIDLAYFKTEGATAVVYNTNTGLAVSGLAKNNLFTVAIGSDGIVTATAVSQSTIQSATFNGNTFELRITAPLDMSKLNNWLPLYDPTYVGANGNYYLKFPITKTNTNLTYTDASKTTSTTVPAENTAYSYIYLRSIILPVSYSSPLKAILNNNGTVDLLWKSATETTNKGYAVLAGISPNNLKQIDFVNSKAPNGTSSVGYSYQSQDKSPSNNTSNYYQLKQVDLDGNLSYSDIVNIYVAGFKNGITLAPNPVVNQLNITNLKIGSNVRVINMAGVVVRTAIVNSSIISLNDMQNLPSGMYTVSVVNQNGQPESHKFMKK